MKYLRQILLLILFLTFLLLGSVAVCMLNPELAKKIGNTLYGKKSTENAVPEIVVTDILPVGDTTSDIPENIPDVTAPENGAVTDKYVAPDEAMMVIPSEVSGRNGYEEIKESISDIPDSEADEIESELGVGNTGEGLDFDPLFYPYYHMLSDNEKALYRQIFANASDLNAEFKPVTDCNSSELKRAFEAVCNDHPELFFINTGYSAKAKGNGSIVDIVLSLNQTANDIDSSKNAFEQKAQEIISGAGALSSDFEKEKYVHDELSKRIAYNLNAPMNQSAYSALVNEETVCAGYARAFQYIMQKLGIPCYYCTGRAGENHAWDIIKLDNDYYNVDVTWDDNPDRISYAYFNKTDADYAPNHIRKSMSVDLPPCNGTRYAVNDNAESYADDENQPDSLPDENNHSDDNNDYRDIPEVSTIGDYYRDCYNYIVSVGKGKYEFSTILNGDDLYTVWQDSYANGTYEAEYINDAMKEIGAVKCELQLSVKPLSEGKYLVKHLISLK